MVKSIQLVGDIGGTKTTLAIIDVESGPRIFLDKATFPSADYSSLEELAIRFLEGKKWKIARASFGVAGPVTDGRVQATNLPWLIEETTLGKELGVPVRLLNDLAALAHAVPSLMNEDLVTLNPGKPANHGATAVIAPGTGLGEAYLQWDKTKYRPFPSEGGHADFAPTDQLQIRLLTYLLARFEHVSYERVCSGSGLPHLYSFLKDENIYPEPVWLRDRISTASDLDPVITTAALEGKAEIALATLGLFISILGSEAGNLALRVLATGGVFLGGGIPPRIIPLLQKEVLLRSFQNKGRFSNFLANVPVHIIRNPDVALIGAACHGLEQERNRD
jgi:glucokinase